MSAQYTIGLDYGTNSVRALIVNVANGGEIASAVWEYAHGTHGVILSRDPNLARQHPADYVKGAEVTIKSALAAAKKNVRGFKPEQVIGIGVDTTGSTPLWTPTGNRSRSKKNSPTTRMRWRGCGRIIPEWQKRRRSRSSRKRFVRNFWPNAAALIPVNGFGAKFCAA
jgi:ribulose kinase